MLLGAGCSWMEEVAEFCLSLPVGYTRGQGVPCTMGPLTKATRCPAPWLLSCPQGKDDIVAGWLPARAQHAQGACVC